MTTLWCFVLSVSKWPMGTGVVKSFCCFIWQMLENTVFLMRIKDPHWPPTAGEVDTRDSTVPGKLSLVWDPVAKGTDGVFFTFLGISSMPGSCIPHFKQDPPTCACDSELSGNYLTAFVKRWRPVIEGTVLWISQDFTYPAHLSELLKSYPVSSLWANLRGRQCWVSG